MKRTKGSQSELGMLYQYGVTAFLAAELSANDEVEDYVLYSSEKSAGKFDDVIARIKLKQETDWYLFLIQVKYKETKKLNVSDVLKGRTVEYFLSDYIRSFNTIITNEAVACRYGIPSDNIRVAIFCDKSIQTPVYLRQEQTFLINLDRYTAKQDSNTILPFRGKCWKFVSKDLEHTEYQRFLNGCYLYLEQPNHNKLNKCIQQICEIASAKDLINYVKDYFNDDFLYKQGLRKEVFEVELQKLRLCDMILPPTSFVDLTQDNRIEMWNKITLEHDVTIVNNEDTDISSCVHSCLTYCINNLLEIDVNWKEYVYPGKQLEDNVIKKFIVYSKTKPLRYWISAPNTLRYLLIELWKCNAVPLILKTSQGLNSFEKYVHLGRSYIIIRDVIRHLEDISDSKVKVFRCVNDIVNLELRNSLLSNTLVSLQGRRKITLLDLLDNDRKLMTAFSSADIIRIMKKRTVSLSDDYLRRVKYAAFIIESEKYPDIVMPAEPYITGSSIKIYCPSNKIQNCIEAIEADTRYRDYVIYHLRWTHNFLEIVKGDKSVLRNCFMDQYEESLHITEVDETAVIIGKVVMPEESQRIDRYVKKATLLASTFQSEKKQICLLSGNLDTFTENINLTSDSIEHLAFTEDKTYFINISTEEHQDIWLKLCGLGFPIFHVKICDGKMELLRYSNCKNLSSCITYDSKGILEDQFFEEADTNTSGIIVLTGEPGMGKTSLLKSLYNNSQTRKYTVFYDLKDFQSHMRRCCMTNPLEFIFNEFHKDSSKIYKKLLHVLLKSRRLILLLDSFDEVRSACEKQLLEFIRTLSESKVDIIIATRLEGCDVLIDEFSVQAVKIEPLVNDGKREYLSHWKLDLNILTNIPSEFITNPLYLNFLRVISVDQGQLSNITKRTVLNKVIRMKIVRWLRSNSKIVREPDVIEAVFFFERLALVAMFGKETVEQELLWICDEGMLDYTKFGIITHFDDSYNPIFHHRIFVDLLTAQWIVKAKEIPIYKSCAKYFYRRLFNDGKLHILNILAEDVELHRYILSANQFKVERILETNSNSLDVSDALGRTALHIAVMCCKHTVPPYTIVEYIVNFLLQNHCDLYKCDLVMGWNWTDYVQANFFERAWFYRTIETIKYYLHRRREKLDKLDILSEIFPVKYFFEIYRWATETNNFTVIQDLLVLQYSENRQFRKLYQACLQNSVEVPLYFHLELDMAITSLHIVTIYNSIPMIRCAIELEVDLNVIDGFTCTPLHYSIMGYFSTLIRNSSYDGYGLGMLSDSQVYLNIIDMLLQGGASCNVQYALHRTSPLYFAVQTGNINLVERFLEFGAFINDPSTGGNTALHVAANYGYLNIVQCLLKHEADISCLNKKGETPRDVAIDQGNTDIAHILSSTLETEKPSFGIVKTFFCCDYVDEVKDIDVEPEMGLEYSGKYFPTCIHLAACLGAIDIVEEHLENGVDVNIPNVYGCTPLRIAARQGHVDITKLLIENGANVNTPDKSGLTPLHSATWQDDAMILKLLLENGACVDAVDYYGKPPLHHAIIHKSTNFVRILLDAGANVNRKCKRNGTPLVGAAVRGDEDLVRILLEKGALINTFSENGDTAFHFAIKRNHINVVKLLFEKGSDTNGYNREGYTGLHLAVIQNAADIVRLLLKLGVNINAQCLEKGYTPLHFAVIKQYTELITILLDHGVHTNAECKCGYTPFFIAVRQTDIHIVRLLLEHKANMSIDEQSAQLVVQRANREGHPDLVELLLRKQNERRSTELN